MNSNPSSDPTVAYYDAHADKYSPETLRVEMDRLYEPFLALIPPGGRILEAGCGSGRDALAFLRRGYQVTAFDASANLARLAQRVIGRLVAVLRFQDLTYDEEFDGIWSCASLLHVPRQEIGDVFVRITRALRPGGVWYMSFKVGEGEGFRDGRFFNDYTDVQLRQLIGKHRDLTIIDTWLTEDVRSKDRGIIWINALVRKVLD